MKELFIDKLNLQSLPHPCSCRSNNVGYQPTIFYLIGISIIFDLTADSTNVD
jgi:hypothetical protein